MDYEQLQRLLWRLVLEHEGKLEAGARGLVKELADSLRSHAEHGNEPFVLDQATQDKLTAYLDGIHGQIKDGIAQAVKLGSVTSMRSELVAQLTEEAFTRQWADGKNLSQRLWKFKGDTLTGFNQVLADGARAGKGISKLVYDLQRTVEKDSGLYAITHTEMEDWAHELARAGKALIHDPKAATEWNTCVRDAFAHIKELKENGTLRAAERALTQIAKAVKKGNEEALGSALYWWFYDKQLYNLKRIARTEMATAQHRAIIASTADSEDVVGYQWRLSASHPFPDICDYYASIDMGLGRGVWTKEAVPKSKAHPHCMCLIVPRVTPVKAQGDVNYAQFVQNLTPEKQAGLLPKWAREAMAQGTKLEDLLRPDGLGLVARKEVDVAKL